MCQDIKNMMLLNTNLERYGMKLKMAKTKVMVIDQNENIDIKINNAEIEQVENRSGSRDRQKWKTREGDE